MSSLCFTGHREFINESDKVANERLTSYLVGVLTEFVETKGVTDFYAGGASGFDNFAANCVLKVKETHPEIKLIEVLPFDRNNMSAGWSDSDRRLLLYLCKKADLVVEEKGSQHYGGCYKDRNQYMVDHADYCVAWYDAVNKEKSGTGQTVRMANRKKIPVKNIFEEFNIKRK